MTWLHTRIPVLVNREIFGPITPKPVSSCQWCNRDNCWRSEEADPESPLWAWRWAAVKQAKNSLWKRRLVMRSTFHLSPLYLTPRGIAALSLFGVHNQKTVMSPQETNMAPIMNLTIVWRRKENFCTS